MSLGLLWTRPPPRLAQRVSAGPDSPLLVVLTLALGIGVNSAVFALLDGVLLRPLPYRDPCAHRVRLADVAVAKRHGARADARSTMPPGTTCASLSELAMVRADTFTLTGDDNPERVRGSRMTASLMPLLGIAPRIGRNFTPAEDLDGTAGGRDPQRRTVAPALRR